MKKSLLLLPLLLVGCASPDDYSSRQQALRACQVWASELSHYTIERKYPQYYRVEPTREYKVNVFGQKEFVYQNISVTEKEFLNPLIGYRYFSNDYKTRTNYTIRKCESEPETNQILGKENDTYTMGDFVRFTANDTKDKSSYEIVKHFRY